MKWNLDDYGPVEDRLAKFWADHPDGRITTSLLEHSDSRYIVQAHVWRTSTQDYGPDAQGLAEERAGSTPVNKVSALENCETSAIGRALANLGYAAKGKRPSREEMDKPAREYRSHSDKPATGANWNCPDCGEQIYDNRSGNDKREAEGKKRWPEFKCKKCDWVSWEQDPGDAGLVGPAPIREDIPLRDDVPPPVPVDDYDETMAPF